MKSKRLFFLLIVLAVSMAFVGCNEINGALDSLFLTTPEVKSADLADYTAPSSADVVDSQADLEQGLGLALSAAGNAGPIAKVLGNEYNDVAYIMNILTPDLARIVMPDAVDSRKVTFSANASMTDEVFTSGLMTITVTEINLSADAEADDVDRPTEVKVNFDGKVEAEVAGIVDEVYNYDTMTLDPYEVDDMIINFNGKGNATAAIDSSGVTEQVDYYVGLALSVGFSLSAPECSGKYVMSFKYVNSAVVDSTTTDFTGGEELTVTIYVYDNNDTLIQEATYTETELTEMMMMM